ncbi:hypothetical protein [Escherichia coli]
MNEKSFSRNFSGHQIDGRFLHNSIQQMNELNATRLPHRRRVICQ